MRRLIFLLLCLACIPLFAQAGDVKVMNAIVLDARTLRIGNHIMQLDGIDAPEPRQKCHDGMQEYLCGKQAQMVLDMLSNATTLTCRVIGQTPQGQETADCTVSGENLSALMVESGWALDASGTGRFAAEQQNARANNQGLWRGMFTHPQAWRRGDRFLRDPRKDPMLPPPARLIE